MAFDNQENENEDGLVDREVELMESLEEIDNLSKQVGMTKDQLEEAKELKEKMIREMYEKEVENKSLHE